MKNLILTIAMIIGINTNCQASTGELDVSFSGNGWVENDNTDESYIQAVVIDSKSRVVVVEIFKDLNVSSSYFLQIKRYLANGQRDQDFITGTYELNTGFYGQSIGLELDENDGVFFAFPYMTCLLPSVDCQEDVLIIHLNHEGSPVGSQLLAFDSGSSYELQDDVFADMAYNSHLSKLVVAVTADRVSANDTDFGVAMYDINNDGNIAVDNSFSTDGKEFCFFDHFDSQGSQDIAKSVLFNPNENGSVIIGGSAYEGNGDNSDGWNLAFCQLDVLGMQQNKWSTQNMPDVADDREILQDMAISEANVTSIIAVSQIPGAGGMNFGVVEYLYNYQTNEWHFNSSFGDGITGWSSIDFNQLFVGSTNDIAKAVFVQADGKIVISGTSDWVDNFNQYSQASLAQLNIFGQLESNWAESGKVGHNFSNTVSDDVTAMAQDATKKEIYITGNHTSSGQSASFIANISNDPDLIFRSGFD